MEDEASSMFLLPSDSWNNTHTLTLNDKVTVLNEHTRANGYASKIAQATLNIQKHTRQKAEAERMCKHN